ncbi:NADH-quinone oxidoreductase subunit NuoF [candidate division KSB1 bacterium]|nr:NADH-quinone oxidoreductase subunit NuoF [candidate division KSB1 bacterium]
MNILLNYERNGDSHTLKSYLKRDGYKSLSQLKKYQPAEVLEEVKRSGIRGRGGAGFPAGLKWSFLPKHTEKPIYLICNGDEGEPGTFKDRVILEENPHMLIEGIIFSSYAINAAHAYIYIRGEYGFAVRRVQAAVKEAYDAGYLGKPVKGTKYTCDITVHQGAGAYVVGDETGLMNSIEGKKGQTRNKPPFPAIEGLYGCPTIINNVETLASVPYIIENGGANYAKLGTEKSTGTKLLSISGHVRKPGVYEVVMGYPFMKFLNEYCGGVLGGRKLKAVIPGGSSTPVLRPEDCENMTLDYESISAAGSSLGSGAIMIIAEGTCMVKTLKVLTHFYHHESCGQCTPCREGTGWLNKIVGRIEAGQGTMDDLDLLTSITKHIAMHTICPLGDAACGPVDSFVKKFRDEFVAHIELKKCPYNSTFTRLQERV